MRNLKRTLSIFLAVVMVLALMMPAMAATPNDGAPTAVITIEGSGSAFAAYRLFDLTTSLKAGDTHADNEHTPDCYNYSYTLNEKYRQPIIETMGLISIGEGLEFLDNMTQDDAAEWEAFIESFTSEPSKIIDSRILNMFAEMTQNDLRLFADSLYAYLRKQAITPELTTATKVFPDAPQGYYMITETATAGNDDTVSSVILDTNGLASVTVYLKEEAPTLQKAAIKNGHTISSGVTAEPGETIRFILRADMIDEINENLDMGFELMFGENVVPIGGIVGPSDSPDPDIDHIYPENPHDPSSLITRYPEYYLKFIDTPKNMTYVPNSARVFFVSDAIPYVYDWMDECGALNYDNILSSVTESQRTKEYSYVSDIPALELTKFSTINWAADTKKLTVEMENLYDSVAEATADSRFVSGDALDEIFDSPSMKVANSSSVYVTYEVTLDEEFEAGAAGNRNSAVLEYSNDPYTEGSHGTTSEKPDAQAEVYSWSLKVNKVENLGTEANPDFQPLAGARFKLQKIKLPANLPSSFETPDDFYDYLYKQMASDFESLWVDYLTDPVLNTDGTTFTFNGLKDNESFIMEDLIVPIYDESGENVIAFDTSKLAGFEPGIYRLVETVVPQGYNKADDLFFFTSSDHKVNDETGAHEFILKVYDLPFNEITDDTIVPIYEISNNVAPTPVSEHIFISTDDAGQMETTVLNVTGTILPATGGAGTTMLYVGGVVLMLLAAGFVVLKMRKKPDIE